MWSPHTTWLAQVIGCPSIEVVLLRLDVSHIWPTGTHGFTRRATISAPSMLRRPLPCVNLSAPGSGSAVACRMALIAFGETFLLKVVCCTSSIAATTPDTTAVDMLVPDSRRCVIGEDDPNGGVTRCELSC